MTDDSEPIDPDIVDIDAREVAEARSLIEEFREDPPVVMHIEDDCLWPTVKGIPASGLQLSRLQVQ